MMPMILTDEVISIVPIGALGGVGGDEIVTDSLGISGQMRALRVIIMGC